MIMTAAANHPIDSTPGESVPVTEGGSSSRCRSLKTADAPSARMLARSGLPVISETRGLSGPLEKLVGRTVAHLTEDCRSSGFRANRVGLQVRTETDSLQDRDVILRNVGVSAREIVPMPHSGEADHETAPRYGLKTKPATNRVAWSSRCSRERRGSRPVSARPISVPRSHPRRRPVERPGRSRARPCCPR